jgi:hypothetical protein
MGWSSCSIDQLRVVSDHLISLLIQSSPYISSIRQQHLPLLDLNSAVGYFGDFCISGLPR